MAEEAEGRVNDPERRYLEAWLALANRLVAWEHACREEEAPPELTLTFDNHDQATIVQTLCTPTHRGVAWTS